MASSFPGFMDDARVLTSAPEKDKAVYRAIYREHCHRIYTLAFWMTDNELVAEQLSANTFLRAFSATEHPQEEHIDQAFLTEVRELTPVGALTLNEAVSPDTSSIRGRMKRIHMERAVVALPATERLIFLLHDADGYEHARIAHLLRITEEESQFGLHQARVKIRHLVAHMA